MLKSHTSGAGITPWEVAYGCWKIITLAKWMANAKNDSTIINILVTPTIDRPNIFYGSIATRITLTKTYFSVVTRWSIINYWYFDCPDISTLIWRFAIRIRGSNAAAPPAKKVLYGMGIANCKQSNGINSYGKSPILQLANQKNIITIYKWIIISIAMLNNHVLRK